MLNRENMRKFWFIGMICSFAYELPIFMISNLDKANPRLFDLFFIVGIFLFNKEILWKPDNKIARGWEILVFWMVICAVIWSLVFLPSSIALFSIYYVSKYVEGVLVVRMILLCKDEIRNTRLISNLIILMGVFVAIYSIPQYLNEAVRVVEYAPGKTFTLAANTITGPFNSTYFHIAQFTPLSFIICFQRFLQSENIKQKMFFLLISLFISWPSFFSGSRTFLFLFLLVFFFICLFNIKKLFTGSIIIILIFTFSELTMSKMTDVFENSYTFSRMENMEDGNNSFDSRLSWVKHFNMTEYEHEGVSMPFIGAGFYVAPINGFYRIGYGFHNNYIFAFEQIGLIGLLIWLFWSWFSLKKLWASRKNNILASPLFIYYISLLIVGFTGQTFWRGFGNANMNTFIIVMMVLASLAINSQEEIDN